jgi:hypothetical protein
MDGEVLSLGHQTINNDLYLQQLSGLLRHYLSLLSG